MSKKYERKIQVYLRDIGGFDIKIDGSFGQKSWNTFCEFVGYDEDADTPSTDYPADDYQLTDNFKLREFHSRYGKVPQGLIGNFKLLCETIGEPFRARLNEVARLNGALKSFDDDIAVTIRSGYRTQAQNDAIYNKVNKPSMHLVSAFDIVWDYNRISKVAGQLIAIDMYHDGQIGGLGFGASTSIIHMDIRHRIRYESPDGLWGYQNGKAIWIYGSKHALHPDVIVKLKEYGYWDRL